MAPPRFERCLAPLVIWSRWPFNAGESFGIVFMRLAEQMDAGRLSPKLAPVMSMPHGMRMPSFMRVYLQRCVVERFS